MSSLSLICTILCAALSLTQATGFGGRPANAVGEYIAQTGFYQSLSLTDEKPIIEMRSEFQDISVMRSEYYGKILMLDGVIQLTERDANSYNEMMTHPAMFSHPNPRRVLVIGGGDGYVLSEVLKHPEVEHVDHVDLDGAVVQVCKAHFVWGNAWDDPRVSLHIADGAEFIKNATAGSYDVIIQDSSDPFTWDEETGEKIELPSKSLYTDEHFENISMALGDKGVFSFQAETFNIEADLEGIVEWRKRALDTGFSDARYGSIAISSYPTGQIGFLLCRKSPSSSPSMENVVKRYNRIKETSYYQPKLQESAFSLPLWVERRIYQTGGASEGDDIDILEVDPNGDIINWDIIAKSLR